MCAYDPKTGSELFRSIEAENRKAATKSLHKRQKLLFCSRIKCIHHIITARIFVAWFPLFGCFALILKDGFAGEGEGGGKECLLRNRDAKEKNPFVCKCIRPCKSI